MLINASLLENPYICWCTQLLVLRNIIQSWNWLLKCKVLVFFWICMVVINIVFSKNIFAVFVLCWSHYSWLCYLYIEGTSWPWSYGSWIYNCLCNQCLSPLMSWVRITIRARRTSLCDKVCQRLATGLWFSPPIKLTATILLKYYWKWR